MKISVLILLLPLFWAGCSTAKVACDPMVSSCMTFPDPIIEPCPDNLRAVQNPKNGVWKCVLPIKHANPSARAWCQKNTAHSSPMRPDLRTPECEEE